MKLTVINNTDVVMLTIKSTHQERQKQSEREISVNIP